MNQVLEGLAQKYNTCSFLTKVMSFKCVTRAYGGGRCKKCLCTDLTYAWYMLN